MPGLVICIRCGEEKKQPWQKCPRCGFDPSTDEAGLVKSVYLSTGRYEDPDDQSRYEIELRRIAEAIKNGRNVEYDAAELERLRQQEQAVEHFSPWGPLFRLFLPAILFIGALVVVYLVLRQLHH